MRSALLLSGGMDSIAIAFWKRPDLTVTVDYGQVPARAELRAAASAAADLGIPNLVVRADLSALGSGDLAGRRELGIAPRPEWWPYRNQMLVTLAAMASIPHGVTRLLVGSLATDRHHADGRPEFVEALGALLALQEGGMTLEAPAIAMDAAQLVRESRVPPELLAWAHSCHVANEACGECGGCRKHYRTMAALGVAPY